MATNASEHLGLHLWEPGDQVLRTEFNQNWTKIDTETEDIREDLTAGLAAAQAQNSRGLSGLKSLAYDLCRLAYQLDGSAYTGFRKSMALDGLGSENLVASTTGAAVLEPDNGRVRLAVNGWSGGSIPWSSQSLSIPAAQTDSLLTQEWSPAGSAALNSVTISGSISNGVTTSVQVHVVLMRGDTELAASASGTIPKNSGNTTTLTLSFSTPPQITAENTYRLKIVVYNSSGNTDQSVTISGSSIPVSTTPVTCTQGSFTTQALSLPGQDLTVWVQASTGTAVTAELGQGESWTALTLTETRDSQTPEGTACQERIFSLALDQPPASARLRFSVTSQTECMIYGYGATAI